MPKTLPVGGDYGDRKALAQQQSAAPMDPQRPGGGGATPAGQPRPGSQFGGSAFAPTQRPGEPMTAGIDWGAGPGQPRRDLADDATLLLKVLFEQNPSPQLARLLARVGASRGR